MIRRTIGLVAIAAAVLPAMATAQRDTVVRVHVSGVIELGLAPFIGRAIREAEEAGARAVILELETPGGRVDAAQQIVKAVTASTVPVYAYVNAHAWSAGAMIALAADSIYMGPVSSIGAATPVIGAGEKASEKIVSAMRGEFRALAEARGLDPRLAEAMVDESIEVDGVVEEGKLLTLTGGEAVELGFASAEVTSLDDLLARVGLANADVATASINWAERLVRFLSHPIVAPILLSMGTLGLIIEIKTPTFGLAGLVGLTSFAAFFGSHLLIGLAGWEEIILLGAGIVALGIEVFVVPGFGIAGAISILFIASAVFLALIGNLPMWKDVVQAAAILSMARTRRFPRSIRRVCWRGRRYGERSDERLWPRLGIAPTGARTLLPRLVFGSHRAANGASQASASKAGTVGRFLWLKSLLSFAPEHRPPLTDRRGCLKSPLDASKRLRDEPTLRATGRSQIFVHDP